MITAIIVTASILAGALFVGAWLAWPRLRLRVEAPKHTFLDRARRYDRERAAGGGLGRIR